MKGEPHPARDYTLRELAYIFGTAAICFFGGLWLVSAICTGVI